MSDYLDHMKQDGHVMVRELNNIEGANESCYYSKSLYFDELYVAKRISNTKNQSIVDKERVENWINRY
jgi:exodeoxyribonuclease V alpha subunit